MKYSTVLLVFLGSISYTQAIHLEQKAAPAPTAPVAATPTVTPAAAAKPALAVVKAAPAPAPVAPVASKPAAAPQAPPVKGLAQVQVQKTQPVKKINLNKKESGPP